MCENKSCEENGNITCSGDVLLPVGGEFLCGQNGPCCEVNNDEVKGFSAPSWYPGSVG